VEKFVKHDDVAESENALAKEYRHGLFVDLLADREYS
jgi:hypothetical protein